MKIVDFFDRIYVINLPYRKDRLNSVTKELGRAGISFCPGKVEVFSAIRPEEPAGFPDIGWRGCFLSHLGVIKQAKKDKLNNVLIMEDDLLISRRFIKSQHKLLEQLSTEEWGFVYFGHVVATPRSRSVELINYSDTLITTHCYGVNASVFDRLIDYLEDYASQVAQQRPEVDIGVDSVISLFRKQNKDIVTLIASPSICVQSDSTSDLAGHGPKATGIRALVQSIPMGKSILNKLRVVKRWMVDV